MRKQTTIDRAVAIQPARRQGEGEVRYISDVSRCHGLRPCPTGLERAYRPMQIAECGRTLICTDILDGDLYLFSQQEDGQVYVEPCGEGNHRLREALALGRIEEPVVQGAAVGDFMVLRLRSGELVYVAKGGTAEYKWLGRMPQLPEFQLTAQSGPQVSQQMGAVKFATPITELDEPVPAAVCERVWSAWTNAWEALRDGIHSRGCWIEPVRVQLGMRLWDDTLICVSEPVVVSPSQRPALERVSPWLLWDTAKQAFTGTESVTLSGCGYQLALSLSHPLPAEWQGIIQGIEVWVSREGETLSAERVPQMLFGHNSQGNFLSFTPAAVPLAQTLTEAQSAPIGRLSLLGEADPLVCTLYFKPHICYDSQIGHYSTPLPTRGASCILGYSGFLHIGVGQSVYTSMRGNPFVPVSVSEGLGAKVLHICPQLSGGGAFTRQYLYVGTERGVMAVCHRQDGVHTNSRSVSQQVSGLPCLWCATDSGVFTLTDSGTLLRLKDSKAEMVLTHLHDVQSLVWSQTHSELWLCTATGSMVLCPDYDMSLYTRSESMQPLPGVYAPSLAYDTTAAGMVCIFDLDSECEPATTPAIYEQSVSVTGAGRQGSLTVRMSTAAGSNIYEVCDPAGMVMCAGVCSCKQSLRIPLTLPVCELMPTTYQLTLRLRGNIVNIDQISLML